jgi:isopentenyl diphosphate isomerase/L-lactate dehydrogenase-like FMN-dependent dehydrogenase
MMKVPKHRQALQQIPADVIALSDYERLASQFMPYATHEYIASGNADELTLQTNRHALDAICIYNRVLQNCAHGNTQINLMGESFHHPFLLAPVACQQLVHPDGELATAQAAAVTSTGMIASTLSSYSLEDIAQQIPRNKWFQLYFQEDRQFTLSLVRRAEQAGFTALVFTVDVPVSGLRNRAQRAGFVMPSIDKQANLHNMPPLDVIALSADDSMIFQGVMAVAPTWKDLAWLATQTQLPIILKGISHADDALRAMNMGLAGVIVSNHGGRSLDSLPATIQSLPLVRKAVGKEFTVLMDGGIRRGTDIFKAIALGADAVLIGRPQIQALAVAGALGVAHMLQLLQDELEMTMALAGCATINDITSDALFFDDMKRS